MVLLLHFDGESSCLVSLVALMEDVTLGFNRGTCSLDHDTKKHSMDTMIPDRIKRLNIQIGTATCSPCQM